MILEKNISVDLKTLFEHQRNHLPVLKASSAKSRLDRLKRIEKFLIDPKNEAELEKAMWGDLRKPAAEVMLTETGPLLMTLKHIRKNLRAWMREEKVPTPLSMAGLVSSVRKEPKGNILVFSPWNYPFQLALNATFYAIAAGNAVIIKPSEITGQTSAFIKKMITSLFPPEEVVVVEGDAQVAGDLLKLPFNHIFFTGSPQVGKIVMQAAAKHLTSVTLELGGKSPAIIDETVNVAKVAEKTAWAKCLNNGQTCIAPDYMILHSSIREAFIKAYNQSVQDLYNADGQGIENSPDYGRIINDRNFERLEKLISDAVDKGAVVHRAGEHDPTQKFMGPLLLDQITEEMEIMQEEIFGPILPVLTYNNLEEIPEILAQRPTPLSFYIRSKSRKTRDWILEHSASGGAVINDYMVGTINPDLPFGGMNQSGIGKSNGEHSFREFSNERGVVKRQWGTLKFFFPPYPKGLKNTVKTLFKWL